MDNLKYFFYYDADIPKGLEVRNFSPTHFAWLSVTLVLIVVGIFVYSRLSGETRRKVMKALAVAVIMLELARTAWALSVGHYDIARHAPAAPLRGHAFCRILCGVYGKQAASRNLLFHRIARRFHGASHP